MLCRQPDNKSPIEQQLPQEMTYCFLWPVARSVGMVLFQLLVGALPCTYCVYQFLVMFVRSAMCTQPETGEIG